MLQWKHLVRRMLKLPKNLDSLPLFDQKLFNLRIGQNLFDETLYRQRLWSKLNLIKICLDFSRRLL